METPLSNEEKTPLWYNPSDIISCALAYLIKLTWVRDNVEYDLVKWEGKKNKNNESIPDLWKEAYESDTLPKSVRILYNPEDPEYKYLIEGIDLCEFDPSTEEGNALWEDLFKKEEPIDKEDGVTLYKWSAVDQLIGMGQIVEAYKARQKEKENAASVSETLDNS